MQRPRARDGPVAEWILGALLGASTGLLEYAGATTRDRSRSLQDLGGSTVLIVGMGSIGRRLRAFLEPIGARVIGVGSHARDGLHGPDELPQLLSAADSVMVLAPLTDATRGLIGRDALRRLRDGAVLINAARGPVVDTDALVTELTSGRLRAVLDEPGAQLRGLGCLAGRRRGDGYGRGPRISRTRAHYDGAAQWGSRDRA